jgi:hypothetical protein
MSMAAVYDPAPRSGAERILLIMLPGAKAQPQDLLQHGFVRELRARNLPVDVVAVEAHLGHYLDRSLNGHLTDDSRETTGASGLWASRWAAWAH